MYIYIYIYMYYYYYYGTDRETDILFAEAGAGMSNIMLTTMCETIPLPAKVLM